MVDRLQPIWLIEGVSIRRCTATVMTLDQWMKEQGITAEKLSAEIGTSSEAVRRYRSGSRMPGPEIAERIVAATNGAVAIQDLHDARLAFLHSVRDGKAA
jgi:transcriptional regulator with XRE-family HTH domain